MLFLEEKILEFARLLRKGGVNVSVTQVIAAIQAAAAVGLAKEDFYTALLSTLIVDQMDQPLFDKLFRLYFFSLESSVFEKHTDHNEQETDGATAALQLVDSIEGTGMGRGAGATPYLLLVKAVRETNYPLLRKLGKMGIESLGDLEQGAVAEIDKLVDQAKVAIGWYQAVNTLEKIRVQEKVSEIRYCKWLDCLSFLEKYMESLLEDLLVRKFGSMILEEIALAANIREKEFFRLDQLEIQEIRKQITKMARKLASRYARRYRRAKHGKIDLRRTIKNAMINGGTPIRLKYRRRVISKPELVLLCDVSGSVAVFSEFMLQLVYTIQNRFSHIRSFLFVNTVDEVTEYFTNNSIEEALDKAFAKARYAMSPFSDYGRVFRQFEKEYLPTFSSQSTLIILGDARNNYRHDERDSLQRIGEQVRKILWFNPQPQEEWNTEDSIIGIYAPYCRQVFECRNLKQLEEVTEAIL
ncbi:MAG TPA: VWA domain-containing protein [Syntrophomonadaceae bacterium]|nr:VWA domain-containing protein [Syntrophomonadaceae bacterium]